MKKILSILLLVLAVSCVPDPLPLDVEQAPTRLVVSTQNFPGVGMVVLLTKSFSALEDRNLDQQEEGLAGLEDVQDLLVTDAEVFMESNGRSKKLTPLGFGFYVIDSMELQAGDDVTFTAVDIESSLFCSATTVVMETPSLGDVSFTKGYEYDKPYVEVNYEINDMPGDQYYLLNFYSEILDRPSFERGLTQFEWLTSASLLIAPEDPTQGKVKLREWYRDTLGVSLFNLSPQHYNYIKELLESEQTIPFISEPKTVRGNINGGYGFFGATFPDIRVLELDE